MTEVRRDVGSALAEALWPISRVIVETLRADDPGAGDGQVLIDREAAAYDEAHGGPADKDARHPMHLLALVVSSRLFLIGDTLAGIALIGEQGADRVPPVSYSAQAIARTTLDAAAFCYWLTDPGLDYDERVKRLAQDTMHEVQAGHRVAEYARKDGLNVLSSAADVADACRLWHVAHPGLNAAGYPKIGKREPAWKIIAPLMQSDEFRYLAAALYSEVSDVAHAAASGILKVAGRSASAESIDVYFVGDMVLRRLVPLVWAIHKPLMTTFEYLGWDTERLEKAIVEALPVLERVLDDNE